MLREQKYFDFYGKVRKILYKNNKIIVFIFEDEALGDLYCRAGRETILYRNTIKHKRYHLQMALKGIYNINNRNEESLNNHLFVKKAFLL